MANKESMNQKSKPNTSKSTSKGKTASASKGRPASAGKGKSASAGKRTYADRSAKPELTGKPELNAKPELTAKSEKTVRPVKSEKFAKPVKTGKPERNGNSGKPEKTGKPATSSPKTGNFGKEQKPFYEALNKKKKPTGKGHFLSDDDEFDFEEDYYEQQKRGKSGKKTTQNDAKNLNDSYDPAAKPASSYSENRDFRSNNQDYKNKDFKNKDQRERKADFIPTEFLKYRTEPKCEVFSKCGGCQHQNLTYAGQLALKQKNVENLLGAFGRVAPIVGMDDPYHYRNKVHATFTYDKKGKVVAGIYEEDSHRVISSTDCLIQDKRANGIIKTILKLMPSFKMTPYDEDYGTGFLRHVLIRTSRMTDEVMVVIVGGNPIMPSKNNFASALMKEHSYITTVVFNVNSRKTSMVLGPNETVITGKGYIEDKLCDTSFRISPKSFYQVNAIQAEKMFTKAIGLAQLKGTENVLDAYCGIGTIGLIASHKAGHVIGVELNKDAVADARFNAKQNNIENIEFYQGDAGDFMVEMASENEQVDVVFLDPPRSGSDEPFLQSLVKLSPKTIIYISCGPESLARDLKFLTSNGYRAKEILPYDMFPWTGHVETVVLMTRSSLGEKK